MKTFPNPDSPWYPRFEKAALFLGTCAYSSSLPPKLAVYAKQTAWGQKYIKDYWSGSGLAGSVVGLLTYLLLPKFIAANFISIIVGTLFAVYVSHHAERIMGNHDDSRIVIDEWIGCWVAMVGVPPLWGLRQALGFEVITAFILFRVFDVYKGPWGRRLQNLPGGWGVVMDDVVAGLIANICARVVIMIVGVL